MKIHVRPPHVRASLRPASPGAVARHALPAVPHLPRVASAGLAVILASGCGTLHYSSAEVVDVRFDAPGVVASTVHFAARVAPEWLELTLRNDGTDTVEADWGRSWFVPDRGEAHSLVSAAAVAEVTAAALQRQWDRQVVHPQHHAAVQIVYRSWTGEEPRLLAQPWRSRVPPGASRTVQLYPFEHVRVEPDMTVAIDPLFCTSHPGSATHDFVIHVPLRARSGPERLTVALRTREAQR